jgi:hypothetical protein
MSVELTSNAEKAALAAEKLQAFGGLNLLYIKRQLAHLLGLIGKGRIFDGYTKHDISHVDKMLGLLDWLIPDATQKIMTPADWLLVVLAIYFHDLGMLVTPKEYANRYASGFAEFRDGKLFLGDEGEDYRHKISALAPDDQERFLYQEFVRDKHAERIRAWINGVAPAELGIAEEVVREMNQLLGSIDKQFRRDLGLVCESHHRNDLEALDKYRVSQPYGDSEQETANLQYAAILLRASDLLHMTSDRAPSIEFRTINPTDPLSQQEWAKQMAVKRVRPKLGINAEGEPDPSVVRDTIEVYAYFTQEDGFFGLTSYLAYVASQLIKCHDWISITNRKNLARHEFPWTKLDDSNIETEGFIRDAFQFTIDQAKILDLLTGHTLYNDSSVVLRELVQNSLDAIRTRLYENPDSSPGEVRIHWDSSLRTLSVSDNGTGMTQKVIRDHLLRVGASLYQDQEFKRTHPEFSSISRFGIGVLSTFMIADTVEIVTCHEEESQARRLYLRSVHGKYLVRLLEKNTDPAVASIRPHGTVFKLVVRPSVKVPDVLKTAKYWVVVPQCKVSVTIDDLPAVTIGVSDVKEALIDYLRSTGRTIVEGLEPPKEISAASRPVSVVHHSVAGINIAYAVEWSPYFHEWSFLRHYEKDMELIGTCVQGIRVDTNTPGYSGSRLIALANACGKDAPKTNVARSGLEKTPQRDSMLRIIYGAYCNHVEKEIENLTTSRGHSLTWAVQEANYLLASLIVEGDERKAQILSQELLDESIRELPLLLVEREDNRQVTSFKLLQDAESFWTISCGLFTSAENLIRETSANASIRSVVNALGAKVDFPSETLLCETDYDLSRPARFAFEGREIAKIVVRQDERRLDLMWANKSNPARWIVLPEPWARWLNTLLERDRRRRYSLLNFRYHYQGSTANVAIIREGVEIVGIRDQIAIRHGESTFWLNDTPVAEIIVPMLAEEIKKGVYEDRVPLVIGLLAAFDLVLDSEENDETTDQTIRKYLNALDEVSDSNNLMQEWDDQVRGKVMHVIKDVKWSVFDSSVWSRRYL